MSEVETFGKDRPDTGVPVVPRNTELLEAASALARAVTHREAVAAVVGPVADALSAKAVLLWTQSPGEAALRLTASRGIPALHAAHFERLELDSPCISPEAARRREPVIVEDLAAPGAYERVPLLSLLDVRAAAALPLIFDGALLGVLAFGTREPLRLRPWEAAAVRSLADSGAAALARTLAVQRERELLRRCGALREAVLAIEAGRPLDQVLQTVTRLARQLAHARHAALGVVSSAGTELEQFIVDGVDAEVQRRIGRLPRGRGVLGLLLTEGRALRIDDLSKHPASVGFPPGHPPMRSFLGVPIRIRGRIYGNLYLTDREDRVGFSDEDQENIEALAAHAAVAIENARLIAETERERALLRAVLEQSPEGIVFVDAGGRVVFANEAADALTGQRTAVDRAATLPGPDGDALDAHGRAMEPESTPVARALRGETVSGTEVQLRVGDGTRVPVLVNAAPVRDGTALRGAVLLYQDIRWLHDLERLREEFAAVIAHDLKTPIASIAMHVDAELWKAGERRTLEVKREVFEIIEGNAERLGRMIADLLLVSRLEANRLPLERNPITLAPLVRSVLARVAPMLVPHPVDEAVPDSLPTLAADPARLEQVLTNLLVNAAKHTPPQTPIHVRGAVETRRGRLGVAIEVADEGPGIAHEDVPHLFDRFYQARRARERQDRTGLGLGLYIARGLIEAHDGELTVATDPQPGARFRIWLPLPS